MKKIGLLGGSFDPVHLAHVALAQAACDHLGLNSVELIPASAPWQRAPLAASAEQRLQMLHLAIESSTNLSINSIEIRRGGKTYTLDTLKELPTGAKYYWILGADQLANFCSWHGWRDIVDLVHLIVAQRPGTGLIPPALLAEHLAVTGKTLVELPFSPMAISASDIRQRLATGQPLNGLIDDKVARYIQKNRLYQSPSGLLRYS